MFWFIISVLRLAIGIPKIIFMSKACFLNFRITHLLSPGKLREHEVTTHVLTGRTLLGTKVDTHRNRTTQR